MIEDGVYIIKQEFFKLFEEKGCKFKNNKTENRPTFCCMKDKKIEGLYWAIPTSKITESKNMDRIYKYVNMKKGIATCFYHIGYTNYPAIYCISSAFPIIEKYVEREYRINGKHLVIKNKQQLENIKKKLKRILLYEEHNPNKLEQKITYIKNELMNEISK